MENNQSTKFCKHCGKRIEQDAIICIHCGKQVEELKGNNGVNVSVNNLNNAGAKLKNKWVALILCLFLGGIGAHKFYEGKAGMGVLYIILCLTGLPILFSIFDLIVILTKPTEYYV